LEHNAHKRLPEIKCDLNAVYSLPNTNHIWAAGNLGMMVHSDNGGRTWEQLKIEVTNGSGHSTGAVSPSPQFSATPNRRPQTRSTPTPTPPQTPTPTPRPAAKTAKSHLSSSDGSFNLLPVTFTRVFEQSNASKNPNEKQQSDPRQQRPPSNEPAIKSTPTPTPADPKQLNAPQDNIGKEPDSLKRPSPTPTQRPTGATSRPVRNATPQTTVTPTPSPSPNAGTAVQGIVTDDLVAIRFDDVQRGLVLSSQGKQFSTIDGGKSWAVNGVDKEKSLEPSSLPIPADKFSSYTRSTLRSLHFQPDNQHGYVAGTNGTILGTNDGGQTWQHLTQGTEKKENATGSYSRWPAPWYYLSCLFVAFLLLPALRSKPEDALKVDYSIADVGVSDRPLEAGDPDPLSFNAIALGLSRFIRNEKTMPPLTIAITGEWGSGKSSLMNLLRADLRRYGFRPVWFNAWHHQKEEHLLASLLQNIRLQSIPRWWQPEGFLFRLRLLTIRGWRHWLPVLTLLLVFSFSLSYVRHHPTALKKLGDTASEIIAALKNGEGWPGFFDAIKLPTREGSLLALLISSIGVIVSTLRGIKAFGVSPGTLMTSMSRGLKLRDLNAQTSFRQRFAEEFRDVTQALGARSMPIFIDDLDRCRPSNVLDVLEAVNFLVSSGDCYVVLGMARERVEPSVGLSFKDIAEEMGEDAPPVANDANTKNDKASSNGKEQRVRFARQYLDKLINIEVPVPTLSAEQTKHLLVPEVPSAPPRSKLIWQLLKNWWAKLWPWLLVALVITIGIKAGQNAAPPAPIQPNVPASPTQALAPQQTPASVGSQPTARGVASPTPVPTPDDRKNQKAEIAQPPFIPNHPSYWLLAVLALLLIGAAVWYFSQPRDLVVKDSPDFEQALRIWHQVIYAKQSSPRSIKRFMNRVRYLAMRQRQYQDSLPRWKEWLGKVGLKFGQHLNTNTTESSTQTIPDSVLVALASIHHVNAEWLKNSDLLNKGLVHSLVPLTNESEKDAWRLIDAAKLAHEERFKNLQQAKDAREAFRKMVAGIRVN